MALAEERLDAIEGRRKQGVAGHGLGGIGIRRFQPGLELSVEEGLAQGEDLARLGAERGGEPHGGTPQIRRGHDAVEQSPFESPAGVDDLARE